MSEAIKTHGFTGDSPFFVSDLMREWMRGLWVRHGCAGHMAGRMAGHLAGQPTGSVYIFGL